MSPVVLRTGFFVFVTLTAVEYERVEMSVNAQLDACRRSIRSAVRMGLDLPVAISMHRQLLRSLRRYDFLIKGIADDEAKGSPIGSYVRKESVRLRSSARCGLMNDIHMISGLALVYCNEKAKDSHSLPHD